MENQYSSSEVPARDGEILSRVSRFTMTSVERQLALISSIRYIVRRGVEGCIVECGVWRGGSSMAIALTLLQEQTSSKNLYLFDTYEGMTSPTEEDRLEDGTHASDILNADQNKSGLVWAVSSIKDVMHNMRSTGYPENKIRYVKGPVESTIPKNAPNEPIALLRLDTDWYESTKHELIYLFPKLADGGILIIDDYGHWQGARKAVDEFLGSLSKEYFLHRIDYTGRLLIKL